MKNARTALTSRFTLLVLLLGCATTLSGDRAYLFYFTHPGRRNDNPKSDLYDQRRSSIQVVELTYTNGQITCDRDKPTYIRLHPIGKGA